MYVCMYVHVCIYVCRHRVAPFTAAWAWLGIAVRDCGSVHRTISPLLPSFDRKKVYYVVSLRRCLRPLGVILGLRVIVPSDSFAWRHHSEGVNVDTTPLIVGTPVNQCNAVHVQIETRQLLVAQHRRPIGYMCSIQYTPLTVYEIFIAYTIHVTHKLCGGRRAMQKRIFCRLINSLYSFLTNKYHKDFVKIISINLYNFGELWVLNCLPYWFL